MTQSAHMTEIHAFLIERGWKLEDEALADPHGDYQITWDGDIWRLARFDDSDNADGVAEARWLNVDEGLTLEELKPCLRSIGYGIAP